MAQTERKEMVTNELAKGIGAAYDGIKKGPSRGTIIMLAVVIAVVLIVVLFRYFWLSSNAADSKRWLMLDEAVFSEQVTTLLDDSEVKDSTQHRVLRFKEARLKLSQGMRDLGSADTETRKKARENVKEARDMYEELAKKSSSLSPQLHQEALWNAAKAYEALGGVDDVPAARKLYEKLQNDYPRSALGIDARKQLDRLDDPATQKELDELARELEAK